MEKAERSREDGMCHEGIQCNVRQLAYDFRTKSGRLDFPEGDCCDRTGAIALFTAIDPEVCVIETFAGGKPDAMFRLNLGTREWATLMR